MRLPAVHRRRVDGAGRARRRQDEVLVFIPRRGSGRQEAPFAISADLVGPAIEKARDGEWLSREELTALFAETRPEAIEEIRAGRGRAARGAGGGDGHVRRQPQHQRLERLHRRLRVLRVRAGQALAGRLRARRAGVPPARARGDRLRRDRDLHAVGNPSGLAARGLPALAAGRQGRGRRRTICTCTPTRRWRSRTCATSPACRSREVFARLRDAGLGSTPGTAAEVLHDGVRERISPNKLPVARWVEIIEASPRAGLRSTSTVMFGHIEEPWELAEHMRVIRDAAGAHRRHHRVRAAVVHPVPHAARPHARRRGDHARGEPQAHRGLPARARAQRSERPGVLGQDGPRGRDRDRCAGASTTSAAR